MIRLGAVTCAYLATGAVLYQLFLAARAVVTRLAGVPGRTGPFGESPLDRAARASAATRVAQALAGPAAVYGLTVVLLAGAIHRGGFVSGDSTLIDVMPEGPAAAAGLQDGDRIRSVGGEPIARFEEIRLALAKHRGEIIEVIVERDGRSLRYSITPGPNGSAFAGRLGVAKREEPVTLVAAFRRALPMPFELLMARLRPRPAVAALTGPVGITRDAGGLSPAGLADGMLRTAALTGAGALDVYLLVALFLFPYRRRESAAALSLPISPPRPWVRLVARIVDLAALGLALGLVAAAVNPRWIEAAGNSFVLLTIPLEAVLLATWGTTPGKALLRVSVRDQGGSKLSFGTALRRSAAVWTFGLAANQSIILVTGLMSWRRLGRRGATYWDQLDGHRVDHGDPAAWRFLIAIAVVILAVAYMVAIEVRGLER